MERVFTGKYDDHALHRGKDRYLGYSTIRRLLNPHETRLLDRLLEDFGLIPSKFPRENLDILHDTIAFDDKRSTTVVVHGKLLLLPPVPIGADIRILVRQNHVIIYADEEEVGHFLLEENQ